MEDIQIIYNRKLFFYIICSTLVISWISLGFVFTIFLLGAVYLVCFHKNPIGFNWVKKTLVVFHLKEKGIKLYPYETEILWNDIDTYYIKFSYFRYYLCLKLKKDNEMTEEKNLFYEKLHQSNILNITHEGDRIIEYPYILIKSSTDEFKSKIGVFLKEYSTYFTEISQDRLEISKSPIQIFTIGLISLFVINIFVRSSLFFLMTSLISMSIMFYFYMQLKLTSYLTFTKKGFEFPEANLKLDWNVIKLIEVQSATRDTSGSLIIWFNDIKSFIEENPKFFSRLENIIDYDEEKLNKTGRLKVKCSQTTIGEDALREEFQKYIDQYGQVSTQRQDTPKENNQKEGSMSDDPQIDLSSETEKLAIKMQDKQDIKLESQERQDTINIAVQNNEITSKNTTSSLEDSQELALEYKLELQKLIRIQFKSQCTFNQMIILKEEEAYCLAIRVEGLRLDGYCIFSKNQIKTVSYCHDYYNELLQKEYYFKLNTGYYIDLKKWETIFNSYHMKNHFVEIETLEENYKGILKEISEEKIVLNVFNIDNIGILESVSIDFDSIIFSTFETLELIFLEKYNS
ncbi:hypothetical protein [Alkaliphilus hydrothermalis]|uniref:Uncharacterized protein n=1 Tax=Alkaliphilus hydrothermalis TaxID=1482730 RepID=A0ABS2NMG8_9FIRM|nr:hypothetical protein [Alkaliphilus hydrothermalis]MBM7614137.1 hypothetical protein [Alkaliphilus hydrothermalis]